MAESEAEAAQMMGFCVMIDEAVQADEEVLSYEVSDEALATAAGNEALPAITMFCTGIGCLKKRGLAPDVLEIPGSNIRPITAAARAAWHTRMAEQVQVLLPATVAKRECWWNRRGTRRAT
jgi:hypothetical protein